MAVEIDMWKCYRFPSFLVRAFTICLAIFLPWAAEAGVELRAKTTLYAEDPPRIESTTTLAHDGNLRIDVAPMAALAGAGEDPVAGEGRSHSTIFRGAFEDFLIVDHGEKAFTLIDQEVIEDLEARLQFTMLQLDRRMAELPPEQRRRMRDALAAPAAKAETKVIRTERQAKKSGLECQLFEVRRGDELVKRVWVASWDEVPGGSELRLALEKLMGFTTQLDKAFESIHSEALGGAQIFELGENPFQDFKRLGGLPIHTIEYEDGKPSFETSVEAIAERKLTPRNFLPAESYRRRSWTGE